MQGQEIIGRLHMIAHNAQSYTIHLTMSGWSFIVHFWFMLLIDFVINLTFCKFICLVKMCGPGAVQGGILLTSPCKLELRDPYYRMSQPLSYSSAEDEQPNQLIPTLVCTNSVTSWFYVKENKTC